MFNKLRKKLNSDELPEDSQDLDLEEQKELLRELLGFDEDSETGIPIPDPEEDMDIPLPPFPLPARKLRKNRYRRTSYNPDTEDYEFDE